MPIREHAFNDSSIPRWSRFKNIIARDLRDFQRILQFQNEQLLELKTALKNDSAAFGSFEEFICAFNLIKTLKELIQSIGDSLSRNEESYVHLENAKEYWPFLIVINPSYKDKQSTIVIEFMRLQKQLLKL